MTIFQFVQMAAVGLLGVALFTGVFSTWLNKPDKNWASGFFKSIGIGHEDSVLPEETVHKFQNKQESFNQYVKDQKIYLKDVKSQADNLSEIIQQMPDQDNDVSLVPLKDLIRKLKNQSEVLMDQQKKIEAFNERHKDLDYRHLRSVETLKDTLNEQDEFMTVQYSQYQELKSKLDLIQNKIQKISRNLTSSQVPQFTEKIQYLSAETKYHLDSARQRQDRIQRNNKDDIMENDFGKSKREDLQRRNQDSMANNHDRIEDQTRAINDRIRDQIEKAKDKNRR
jgi:hypothetical protein